MKLVLTKRFENVENILTAVTVNVGTVVFLSYREEDMRYQLLYISNEERKLIELDYTEKYYQVENKPVLFAMNGQFGIVKNQKELFLYSFDSELFESIAIDNSTVLPQRFHLEWRVPISDSSILPICFRGDGIGSDTRYIAFLDVDTTNKQAKWESYTSLENNVLTHHTDQSYLPKVDTAMLKDTELYTFTSGGQTTSVNKWGMDYYAFTRGTKEGIINELLIDSGDLRAIDIKKRGVNGLLSHSQKYLMLIPVFQSDEWKGKPKLFSLDQHKLLDVTFPRGFGKYPQILQHDGTYFWVYLRDKNEIAMCIEE